MEKRIFYFVIAFIMSLGFTAAQAQNMGMMDKKSYVGLTAIVSGEFDSDYEANSGWLLNYGYQFTDMFSGELAYGKADDAKRPGTPAVPTVPAANGNPEIPGTLAVPETSTEIELIELSVLARMPGQIASPFLRLGYSDIDISGGSSESDFLIGVGADFNIGESAAIRLEYNQADYGDGLELDRIQLGTIIRF